MVQLVVAEKEEVAVGPGGVVAEVVENHGVDCVDFGVGKVGGCD